MREVILNPKFFKAKNLKEIEDQLRVDKKEEPNRIPYNFSILDEYPQYVILAYMPKDQLIKEYIKVKPKGYHFHQNYHYPFMNLINWFKSQFKTTDYQKRLRNTRSPQKISGLIPTKIERPVDEGM